jgi:hypothetical protein
MTSGRTAHVCLFRLGPLWITGSLRQAATDRAVDDADCGVLVLCENSADGVYAASR